MTSASAHDLPRRFYIEELQRFLRLVDAELPKPCTIVVVGESALSLAYCPAHAIVDIEVWSASDRVIWTAAERASEKIARPIHLRQALGGGRRGMTFEGRLRPSSMEGLPLLTVLVPEAHDLALLNAARGVTPAAAAELHLSQPLFLRTLLERHDEMKSDESVPEERARIGLLEVIAKLFGDAKAREIERCVQPRSRHRPLAPRLKKGR
jgi:hypothetical protein